ncbi:hypothetical protein BV25DRAFT_1831234 [Artomyces pyxidatus]|uniref:Uncharacterized protein n=1 Tax=Artomyces pyxidatus TaxID=48021 RepID=A0ACB8SLI7_9AGAM|nr:hypothetical protein BV25DRAFT_1831234 [Artomyces pyxidatus]
MTHSSVSTSVSAPGTPVSTVPLKRKADGDIADTADAKVAQGASSSEFDSGVVTCESCGEAVSFRDEGTGGFTTKHWDAHKSDCSNTAQASVDRDPVPNAEDAASASESQVCVSPPHKRRRAKRSEEERIDYLRSDPYVAQFEAYRVLCGSCDKWIRLRPNSTYCSIPWDAHRKSCLAKKGGKAPANEERSAAFLGDSDVKKFDSERVHCRICNRWVSVGSDGQSVKAWTKHRAACQQTPGPSASSSSIPSVPPPSQHQLALASAPMPAVSHSALPPPRVSKPPKERDAPPPLPFAHASTPPPVLNAGLALPPSPPESRRRNAEQRAAILRADPLLTDVEPNRVFCSLCRKWVQLRQDSSYCAYPWQQHRSKCLLRQDKKAAKVGPRGSGSGAEGAVGNSEEGSGDTAEESDQDELDPAFQRRLAMEVKTTTEGSLVSGRGGSEVADRDAMDVDGGPTPATAGKRDSIFADLISPDGRMAFVLQSISYLLRATYEASDRLTIAALVAYLNCAMPPDKHEDFDTAEVIRAAKALRESGKLAFEGDTVKLLG